MYESDRELERAIAKLKLLHESDLCVLAVLACGDRAIPSLRRLLFEREPIGLFQVRCRAVLALAALDAQDILVDFLEAPHRFDDPVENLGEDAVVNAAALALAKRRDRRIFDLLLRLAQRPALTGVIGALGAFGRIEPVPTLIDALQEDASRYTAENALRRIGRPARPALAKAATAHASRDKFEGESRARGRRSALALLADIGIERRDWTSLTPLLNDRDPKIVMLTCRICLVFGPAVDWPVATQSLIDLLAHENWMLREDAETCLAINFAKTQRTIEAYLGATRPTTGDSERIANSLRRVIAHVRTAASGP